MFGARTATRLRKTMCARSLRAKWTGCGRRRTPAEAGEEPEESDSERQPERVSSGQIGRDMPQTEDHRGYGQAVAGPPKPRHEPAEYDAAVRELLRDAVDQRLDEDCGRHRWN